MGTTAKHCEVLGRLVSLSVPENPLGSKHGESVVPVLQVARGGDWGGGAEAGCRGSKMLTSVIT